MTLIPAIIFLFTSLMAFTVMAAFASNHPPQTLTYKTYMALALTWPLAGLTIFALTVMAI
jgi:uncharacterized membrane protein YjjB (DUF3815 family)